MTKEMKAREYADFVLNKVNPALSAKTYRRALKMEAPAFNGNDMEEAFIAGYASREREEEEREELRNKQLAKMKQYYGG